MSGSGEEAGCDSLTVPQASVEYDLDMFIAGFTCKLFSQELRTIYD